MAAAAFHTIGSEINSEAAQMKHSPRCMPGPRFRGGVGDSVPEASGSEPQHRGKVAPHLILPYFMSDPPLINSSDAALAFTL